MLALVHSSSFLAKANLIGCYRYQCDSFKVTLNQCTEWFLCVSRYVPEMGLPSIMKFTKTGAENVLEQLIGLVHHALDTVMEEPEHSAELSMDMGSTTELSLYASTALLS